MTTKFINTYVAAGYTLSSSFTFLEITRTGGIGGTGLYSDHSAGVSNFGTIRANDGQLFGTGVYLASGGYVINHAHGYIGGFKGVISKATLNLINQGTIVSSNVPVEALSGGSLVNGSYRDEKALIDGSEILFGSPADSTIANYGTILVDNIEMDGGGTITNGGPGDPQASIISRFGMVFEEAPGTIWNFGTLQASSRGLGVRLTHGGSVTNGAVLDTGARIAGYTGVQTFGLATVTNHGTIEGLSGAGLSYGVQMVRGGTLTNGGGIDHAALIAGSNGVEVFDGVTVNNFGTIEATGDSGVGVTLTDGALTNGSLNNSVALIEGSTGAELVGAGASANFGTIIGAGDLGGFGVELGGTQSFVNGAAGHQGASVVGFEGLAADGTTDAVTVTNFGTIAGAAGTALAFGNAADMLVVEAGCVFQGAVDGGGGTLKLDGGTGKLSGLFGPGGSVTVSGSMAATTFDDFATLRIGQVATFTDLGAVSLTAGEAILDSGSLTLGGAKAGVTSAGLIEADRGTLSVAGAVKNTGTLAAAGGTLAVAGAVTGTGSATIAGGVLDFQGAFTQDVAFTGKAGTLELAQSQGYAGTVTGFSKSGGTLLDLLDIAFSKATTASYSGDKSGGVLTVTDGTHTAHIALAGDYRASTFVVAGDGHGGTLVHDPARFIAAMAGIGGSGGQAIPSGGTWADHRPALSRPRVMMA